MASDPAAVDAAVVALVKGDAVLMGLAGGFVFFGVAKQGYDTFVIVDRLSHANDGNCFGEAAGEAFVYLVKAVRPGTATGDVELAALRIRELLDGNAALPIVGYALQDPIEEIEAVRIQEVDEANPDRQVQHWGGHYALQVQRREGTRTKRGDRDHAIPRQTRGSINRGDAGRVAQQVDAERGDG